MRPWQFRHHTMSPTHSTSNTAHITMTTINDILSAAFPCEPKNIISGNGESVGDMDGGFGTGVVMVGLWVKRALKGTSVGTNKIGIRVGDNVGLLEGDTSRL